MRYDLIVVGGGISGMVAAICAAERGKKVLILEKGDRIGRKLLATGNGKCNLANAESTDGRYNSAFPRRILTKYNLEAQRKFWFSIGLVIKEVNGRYYPYGEQASIVLNVLRKRLETLGVSVATSVGAEKIEGAFTVNGKYNADNILLATGSNASFGYDSNYLLAPYGHNRKPFNPALVPLLTDKENLKGLKGIRTDAYVTLASGTEYLSGVRDEVIFKDNGVSGSAIFTLSQLMARCGDGDYKLYIDFAPDYSVEELETLFRSGVAVEGMFHKELAAAIRRVASDRNDNIALTVKRFVLGNVKLGAVSLAQVMSGGLLTSEFDEVTLESKKVKGLYAAGEALDVDGECGGFNIMWAVASGMAVGERCASK